MFESKKQTETKESEKQTENKEHEKQNENKEPADATGSLNICVLKTHMKGKDKT